MALARRCDSILIVSLENLQADGIFILVSTVHTWVTIRDNSVFCQADFIGANAQYVSSLFLIGILFWLDLDSAFYDGGVTADNAGNFVRDTVVPALKAACPGKRIMITEYVWWNPLNLSAILLYSVLTTALRTGWPSRGSAYGVAVASISDERVAFISLNCAISHDDTSTSVFAFEYDDQLWKANDNERSFGMFDGKLTFNGDILSASC